MFVFICFHFISLVALTLVRRYLVTQKKLGFSPKKMNEVTDSELKHAPSYRRSKRKNKRNKTDATDKRRNKFKTTVNPNSGGLWDIIEFFIPVSICIILVVISLIFLPYFRKVNDSILTPEEDSSTAQKLSTAIVTALIYLLIATIATFILVFLVVRKCYAIINTIFLVVFAFYLPVTSWQYLLAVFYTFNLPFDLITGTLIVWNFSVVGLMAVFFAGPKCLSRAYHVILAAMIALFLLKALPAWTTWLVLILISLWDLYAVFMGPLKRIAEDKEAKNIKLPVYTVIHTTMSNQSQGKAEKNRERSESSDKDEDENENEEDVGKLGLGDFIFYSILVGEAYIATNLLVAITCFLAIFTGIMLTVVCMVVCSRATMPALPIPIFLALLVLLFGTFCVTPFNNALIAEQIFI